jgi:carboxypeptidase C (cathepsin A)
MRFPTSLTLSSGLLAAATLTSALPAFPLEDAPFFSEKSHNIKRQDAQIPFLPAEITDYKTITTPRGVTIRYKEPGKDGVCETSPDVNSYSGYIDISEDEHVFFWFFESRRDPANDDLTLCESSLRTCCPMNNTNHLHHQG